jgi:hypothetical protein
MSPEPINLTIQEGTPQVYHDTIGMSEVDKDSYYLMVVIQEALSIYGKQLHPAHFTIPEIHRNAISAP